MVLLKIKSDHVYIPEADTHAVTLFLSIWHSNNKKHPKSLTTASKTLTPFYVSDLLFYDILLPQTHQSHPPSWPLNLLSLPEMLSPYLVIESRSHLLQVSTQMSPPERPPQTAYIKFSIFWPSFILLYCTCHSLTHWNIYFHMFFSPIRIYTPCYINR